MNRGETMKFTKNVCVLSDDDLDQVCGGFDMTEFLAGLLFGPIANFSIPFLSFSDAGSFDFDKGIIFSSVPTDLLMVYLSYRGLKAIFSKSSPSCNSKDDKKIETDETKLKEQSACA